MDLRKRPQETFLADYDTPGREQIEFLLHRLQQKQFFYSKAFQDMTQNSLFHYMHIANCKISQRVAIDRAGGRPLTEKELFSLKFVSYAWPRQRARKRYGLPDFENSY